VPWEASSVVGEFMFALPAKGAAGSGPQVAIATPTAPPPPRIEIREEVGLGTLAVSSRVAGVDVWLGEQKIGTTRPGGTLVVSNLPAGTHRVTARKDGHRPWEREVEVSANQRSDVVIDITPLGPAGTIKGGDDAEMVLIPAGEFWMGSTPAEVERAKDECKKLGIAEATPCETFHERERPRHRVHLDAFYIDRYEVTNALFERFVRATGHRTMAERAGDGWVYQQKDGTWQWQQVSGASWRSPSGAGTSAPSDHPVVHVTWDDAQAYCRWAGKRLPTEAEWEKAARGTTERRYPWGEDWEDARANGNMSVKTTARVGSYPNGVSPFGVHDMAGNAMEWVADWFSQDYYQKSPERNPTGPASGERRVLRGGSWLLNPLGVRSASRHDDTPDDRDTFIGFRCARGLLP
jgi:formylglycine-generating enzyme required for sulfatase activity